MKNWWFWMIAGFLTAYVIFSFAVLFRSPYPEDFIPPSELGIGGSAPTIPVPSQSLKTEKNNIDVLTENGNFSIFLEIVKITGLLERLSSQGEFTVFAPTDDAFTQIPEESLYALLSDRESLRTLILHHLVQGEIPSKALSEQTKIGMMDGGSVNISNSDGVKVDGIKVSNDVDTSNGIIYAIDSLLIPPDYLLKKPENI